MNKPTSPCLSGIAAMSENHVIGKNNQLPWHLPADLRHFKNITTGHPILMGRKTYQSIGKPLPNRINLILTHDKTFKADGCLVVSSIEEALQSAPCMGSEEVFVIGGAEVYKQLMPSIQRLYLTIIHHTFVGDAYFPQIKSQEWREIKREDHLPDNENPYAYSFINLTRDTKSSFVF